MIPQHRRFGILHTYASKFVYRDYPLLKLLESFYCFRVLNSLGLSTIPDFSNLESIISNPTSPRLLLPASYISRVIGIELLYVGVVVNVISRVGTPRHRVSWLKYRRYLIPACRENVWLIFYKSVLSRINWSYQLLTLLRLTNFYVLFSFHSSFRAKTFVSNKYFTRVTF